MKRNYSVVIFYLICLVEGFWALYSIWIHSDITNATILSSSGRSWLILSIVIVILCVGSLLFTEWRFPGSRFSLGNWIVSHNKIFIVIAIGLLIGGFAGWILAISPMRVSLFHAYYLRWRPIFIWAALVSIQFVLLGLISKPASFWLQTVKEIFISFGAFLKRGLAKLDTWPAGLVFLGVSFLLGLTKLSFWQFVDEADNLAYGWMITRGNLLYRDIFSQHFPLAYFWSAGVVSIFGNSQAIARISILVLQFVVFTYCMRVTRLYLPIGLTALAWGLTSQFYRGNLVLYDTFDGIFLTAVAILVFSTLLDRSQVKKSTFLVIGFLLGFALLSNPLSLYPAVIAVGGVCLSVIGRGRKSVWREVLHRLLLVILPIVAVLGVFGAYLLITGTGRDFYWDVIWFNANIYNQYTDADPIRLERIVYQIASGLNVFNPQFRLNISPFIELGVERFRLASVEFYYSWIFSSLTFRLSVLLCTVALLLQRKVLPAIFLYVFSASLLIHAETDWHAIPFIWLSLFAGAYYLVKLASPPVSWMTRAEQQNPWKTSLAWLGRFGWRIAYLSLLFLYSWSAIRGGQFLIQNRKALNDRRFIRQIEVFGDKIRQQTCRQQDIEMLVYPFEPMVYFVTKIPPASRYTFMFPWTAQITLPEVIEELRHNPSAVIQVKTQRLVWQNYPVTDYLADLIQFLDQNYKKIDENLWISPELASRCSANPP